MNKAHFSNRGQVLIIFVFAIVGLIGITALAIDGSHIFAERRYAQNAADTAALAGALVKVNGQKNNGWTNGECMSHASGCWSSIVNAAMDRAAGNGYTSDIVHNTVQVFVPPISGPYSNCSSYSFRCADYVQVMIDTNVDTWFAKVLGVPQLHNHVEAVALARYAPAQALFGGESLVVLKPHSDTCNGEFQLSGTAIVTLDGGGIFVNSDNDNCAFKYTSGCATIQLTNGAKVEVFGDPGVANTTCTNVPTISHPAEQYIFPPDELFPEPAECGMPGSSYVAADGIHYRPGYYVKLPPENNVILDPGTFCVENVVKSTNPTKMIGNGVFIYIRDSGQATAFAFQGGTVQLTAPASGPYAGFLFYVAENDYEGSPKNCNINAGSDDTFTGIIWAPFCDVTLNGGSDSVGITAQIVSYTLGINGNGALNVIYNNSLQINSPEVRATGLYR